MKNEINMGSSIIDLYMDGYNEGKNDDVDVVESVRSAHKTKHAKCRASSRRKKAYYKAKSRMAQLNHVAHYTPSPECEQVVHGMLRNHQIPMSETKCELPCGSSIGNKKRNDMAIQKMREAYMETA